MDSVIKKKIEEIRNRHIRTDGGKGSGNFGHKGRPGMIGGSSASGMAISAEGTSKKNEMPETVQSFIGKLDENAKAYHVKVEKGEFTDALGSRYNYRLRFESEDDLTNAIGDSIGDDEAFRDAYRDARRAIKKNVYADDTKEYVEKYEDEEWRLLREIGKVQDHAVIVLGNEEINWNISDVAEDYISKKANLEW